jgi:alpha-ribazole phosphatase
VTRVLLVRHGAPADDARGRCYGRLDVPLSAAGTDEAVALATRLAAVELDAVYTSPRVRARATAEACCEGRRLQPVVDARLRELDFGSFEGRTYEAIEREEPDVYRRWMEEPTTVRFPGGESFADLRVRVAAALAGYRDRHRAGTICVVTHGGVVRSAVADALGLADERIFAIDVGYCRVSVVEWFGETAVVRLVNGSAFDLPPATLH